MPAPAVVDLARPGATTQSFEPRRLLGLVGVALAVPFFAWLPLGLFDAIPSLVDVFGIPGLRIPASVTVFGLLLAAVGFHEHPRGLVHRLEATSADRRPGHTER